VKKPTAYPRLALNGSDPKPRLVPEEEALLPPQFQRPEPMTPEEFPKWKLEHWLRCRCECDDHFDMCLNCITHRQLTDKIQ
jgi:hypothetical protein